MLQPLTDEQRFTIETNQRFQSLVRASIESLAIYWRGHDGADVPDGDRIRWAKSRFLATGIALNPASIIFNEWLKQFSMCMQNVAVYDNANDYDESIVIDYMIVQQKFSEIANKVFDLRILRVEF